MKKDIKSVTGSGGDMVYCLGLIGSLFYFLQHANNFKEGLLGVVKAFLWPAFVIYRLLELLKF